MQPIVTLQHISVVYDHEKPVLTDVNLTIYDRDFIGVIGPRTVEGKRRWSKPSLNH